MRLLCLLIGMATTASAAEFPASTLATAVALRERALQDARAWELLRGLTKDIGARIAGGPNDLKAREWTIARMHALGFDRVWSEPVQYPVWERGAQSGWLLGESPVPLDLAALGGSMGTPAGGIEAAVVRFDSLQALDAAPSGALEGQIAYVDIPMQRHRDGRGYGAVSNARVTGASRAAAKGAVAFVLRSAGTDTDAGSAVPHTGMLRYDQTPTRIPAAALSNTSADALTAALAQGSARMRLELGARTRGEPYTGANVIGEITGRERPEEVVVIGGHLDSWDLGEGAIDDGAGVAITLAAGALIGELPVAPRRSIRVVAWANEEQGLYGGKAYAGARAADGTLAQQFVASESDFGAGRVYALDTRFGSDGHALADQLLHVLAPLGIVRGNNTASGGPDVIALREAGVPVVTLRQDGTHYFDLHHTVNDTLEQVNPADLRQNVAAWVVYAYLAAEYPGSLR